MSRNENVTIKIKNAKLKKIENVCSYFCQDYTAVETAQKLGLSRQTINHYYKIFREKLFLEFNFLNQHILNEVLKFDRLNIKCMNIYNQNIFYLKYKTNILILDKQNSLPSYLDEFIQKTLSKTLLKHKKANCARVLLNNKNRSFLVSGFLKESDSSFEIFLENRLKKFRGINNSRLFSYIVESQIRYNFSSEIIYQKLVLSFK